MEYPEDLRYSREHEWARSENGRDPSRHHRFRTGRAGRRRLRGPSRAGHAGHGGSGLRRGRIHEIRVGCIRPRVGDHRGAERGPGGEAGARERAAVRRRLAHRDRGLRSGRARPAPRQRLGTRSTSPAPEHTRDSIGRTSTLDPTLQRRSRVTVEAGRGSCPREVEGSAKPRLTLLTPCDNVHGASRSTVRAKRRPSTRHRTRGEPDGVLYALWTSQPRRRALLRRMRGSPSG